MTATERWTEVQRVLDGALELPDQAVGDYLDRECRTDHELRREVEELLVSCARAAGFLEQPPASLAAALLDERPVPAGRRIGPYVVIREAGRGGMGVVYVAERNDGQFRQRVALKVLPRGLESDHAIRRFLEERQILASLAHKGIARLLDGGVTDDELPYFAMEFVDGTSIDKFCDERRLDIDARLRHFIDVCEAVQYAHQNLVVHRDLKPSNIMVTPAGSVKLLDFGIAKLLSDGSLDDEPADEMTRTGARWLTPRYASPEQVSGQPVTTMSDVYTLGVLLYELLTGHSPYDLAALTPAELSRVVSDAHVARPSVAVLRTETVMRTDGSSTTVEPAQVAEARSTRRPDVLARRLRGDIDTIVLTALQKDPARRYGSAGALADDVRRHLEGLPVRARPDTLRYRASKFVKRHKVGVFVGGALAASLVAGAFGVAWQGAVASQERARAQQQAATAERASQLLVEMFRLSDPDVAKGATITAREILARGTQRVEADFANDTALQATVLREIGRIYQNLALPDSAERLVRRAVDVQRAVGPSTELAAGLQQLGEIEAARARYADGEPHFREALAMRRVLHRQPHDDVAASARALADMLMNQRKFTDAEPLYRDAIAIERRVHGSNSPHVASTLFSLAVTFHDRGNFTDAEPLFREAVEIYRRVPSSSDPLAATARLQLGNVLLFRQRYEEAEPLFREAVAIRRTMYPPGHRSNVAASAALAALLHNTSRFREAEPVLRGTLEAGARALGADHPDILQLKQILGVVLTEQGRYAEADQWLTDAIDAWRAREGSDMPMAIILRIQRGENRLVAGQLTSAQADFREAVAAGRRTFGEAHPFVALGVRGLARVDAERGNHPAAEVGYRRALAAFGPTMRPTHHYVLGTRRSLGEAVAAQARMAEADSILRAVVTDVRASLAKGHVETGRALQAHGEVRLALGDAVEAERLLREALAVRIKALGAGHWHVAQTESTLGAALAAQGRHAEAQPLLTEAYDRLVAQRGAADRSARRARARLER